MFTVQSRVEFDAAHFLQDSNTPCDVIHGHRWKVDVALKAPDLNGTGFMINFTLLKKWMKEMVENIDHNLANFYLPQSTAEQFSLYFFMCMAEKVYDYNRKNKTSIEVDWVSVAETPNNIATFKIADLDIRKERARRKAIQQWADPEKRARIHDAIIEANQDPVLRHIRSMRMKMENPMSNRQVVDRMLRSLKKSQKTLPNKGEKMLIDFFSENKLPLRFCGDGSFILDGKIPDFVNYEKRVVLEYNGRFWHSKNDWNDAYDDSEERREFFESRGWHFYLIWDDEFEAKKPQIVSDLKALLYEKDED